jgi:hypothetical protein
MNILYVKYFHRNFYIYHYLSSFNTYTLLIYNNNGKGDDDDDNDIINIDVDNDDDDVDN